MGCHHAKGARHSCLLQPAGLPMCLKVYECLLIVHRTLQKLCALQCLGLTYQLHLPEVAEAEALLPT